MTELDTLIERMPWTIKNTFMKSLEILKKRGYMDRFKKRGLDERFVKVLIYGEFMDGLFSSDYLEYIIN